MSISRRNVLLGAGGAAVLGAGAYGTQSLRARHYDRIAEVLDAPAVPVANPLSEGRRRLVHYASLAANGHNTQAWRFAFGEGGMSVLPDFTRRTPVVDPDDHHLWASLGGAVENLTLAARASGLETDLRFTDERIELAFDTAPARVSQRFGAIPKRQSIRADYDGKALSLEDYRALEAAGQDEEVDLVLLTDTPKMEQVLDLVIEGNTRQIADPEFVRELKDWMRFNRIEAAKTRDGLFTAGSGNPTLPGWLGDMLFPHVFTAEAENEKYRGHVRSSAGLAVFVAKEDSPPGWMAAGRACQRFALEAAARDIRYAFLNQPVEVIELRPELAGLIGVAGRRPNLVIRFGHGPTLPRALRRAPEAVIDAA